MDARTLARFASLALVLAACGGSSSTDGLFGGSTAGADAGTDGGAGGAPGDDAGNTDETVAPDDAGNADDFVSPDDAGNVDETVATDDGGTTIDAPEEPPATGCTSTSDVSIFTSNLSGVTNAATQCGLQNALREPATLDCIEKNTGLSATCSACLDAEIGCVAQHCLAVCFNAASPLCTQCRQTNCDPAFATCSGLTP